MNMNYKKVNTILKDIKKNPNHRNAYTEDELEQAVDVVNSRLQHQIDGLEQIIKTNNERTGTEEATVLEAMDQYRSELERKQAAANKKKVSKYIV